MRVVLRTMVASSAVAIATACGNNQEPDTLREGEWGGTNIAAAAAPEGVFVQWPCSFGEFPPLLIDDAGRFDLRGTYTNSAFGGGTGSVRLRGRVVGTQLRVVFTFPRDSTPAWADTESILEEHATPEFTTVCAL